MKDYKNLTKKYLDKYKQLQEIEVVYRPHQRVSWGKNRKVYKGNMDLHYNHRTILTNEIVFDFDEGNIPQNYQDVKHKLEQDKQGFEAFQTKGSTKEGIRLHSFWDFTRVKDKSLMKKLILKHYAYGKGIDYQLCGKHLIRCEYGFYEKEYAKQVYNLLLYKYSVDNIYGEKELNIIPQEVWDKYYEYKKNQVIKSYARSKNLSVNNELINKLLKSKVKVEDGRERIMFFLIHQLKEEYSPKELGDVLINWYHYNGGHKMSVWEIRKKIKYHWNRSYVFRPHYLETLIGDTE